MLEYGSFLLVFTAAAFVAGLLLFLTSVLGPKRPSPTKQLPFECGVQPFDLPKGHLSVKFYVMAMLFIVFDVELAFLFPWAVLARELRWYGFFAMASFLVVVIGGFIYAWRKGALDWE